MGVKIIRNTVMCGAVLLCTTFSAISQSTNNTNYFQYPTVPENLETLTERANFFIEKFWERCNMKSAFSSRMRMQKAFNDYATFIPYADAEIVHKSIDNLIASVNKNPQNLIALAEMAEGAFYADTARIICDECYLPFAQAVVNNKKVPKAEKARFEYQAKSLELSQVGMIAPDFEWVTPDGNKGKLSDIPKGQYVLLFFNDPDCDDCELARVRLAADLNLNNLIDKNLLKVVSIYPREISDEWIDRTSVYNKKWIIGAAPYVDEIYDMRNTPTIYYLNGKHEILSKTFEIDNLLEAFRIVNEKIEKQ